MYQAVHFACEVHVPFALDSIVEVLEIHKILFWQGSSYCTFKNSVLP